MEPRPRGVNVVTVCGRSEMCRLVSGDPVFVSVSSPQCNSYEDKRDENASE